MSALLEVRDVEVTFGSRRDSGTQVRAVRGVSLDVHPGETVGVVGESGSGKSTLARAIMRLNEPTAGTVAFEGEDLLRLSRRAMRRYRRHMQMVFQDPYSSLDPTMQVAASVTEPLRFHQGISRRDMWATAADLLESVGLDPSYAHRFPSDMSGGQRQRVAIARAISTHPRLLICDEPVSALDASTQNQVINLLADLGERHHMAMLVVAHDLAVVNHISDRIVVMYLGEIVESGPARRVIFEPAHPYTHALVAAVPKVGAGRRQLSVVRGEAPDPTNPPPGCAFSSRCPHVHDRCRVETPRAVEIAGGGTAACHLLDETATATSTTTTSKGAP